MSHILVWWGVTRRSHTNLYLPQLLCKWQQVWTRRLAGDGILSMEINKYRWELLYGDIWRFGKVPNFCRNGPQSNLVWGKIYSTPSSLFGYCVCETVFEPVHRQGLSVGYESTNNRLRKWERVEWMVCHSDRVSSSGATTCSHQFSQSEWWRFFNKESGYTFLTS